MFNMHKAQRIGGDLNDLNRIPCYALKKIGTMSYIHNYINKDDNKDNTVNFINMLMFYLFPLIHRRITANTKISIWFNDNVTVPDNKILDSESMFGRNSDVDYLSYEKYFDGTLSKKSNIRLMSTYQLEHPDSMNKYEKAASNYSSKMLLYYGGLTSQECDYTANCILYSINNIYAEDYHTYDEMRDSGSIYDNLFRLKVEMLLRDYIYNYTGNYFDSYFKWFYKF